MPALLAALLLLATEVPLTTPALGPAALAQYGAIAASDGDGYLVLWTDGRAQMEQTRATRVSRDGDVLDPAGILVTNAQRIVSPAVIWAGTSYLFVYGTYDTNATWGVRIDRDGRIVDGPRVLLENAFPSAVAWNGTDVVIGYTSAGAVRARFLGSGADILLASGPGERYALTILATGSHLTAFWSNQIARTPTAPNDRIVLEGVRFTATGTIDPTPRAIMDAPYMLDLRVASDGTDFVAVWRDASNMLNARAISADLATAGPASQVPEPILSDPTLLWTGDEYVLVGYSAALRAVRLDRQGRPGDAQSFDDPSFTGTAPSPAVATNGTDLLVAWNGSAAQDLDVFATIVSESTLARRKRSLLSLSAPRQTRPIVTSGGTSLLVVWNENQSLWAKRLGVDGTPIDAAPLRIPNTIGRVAVTLHGDGYILAWYDFLARELVTLRVPRDGTLRTEGGTRVPIAELASFAIASAGDVTLLAWSEYESVRALRLRADGSAADTTPLTLTEELVETIDVASNGTNEFLVLWGTMIETNNPHAPLVPRSIRGARVTSSLMSLDPNGFAVADSPAPQHDPAAAWNGREWLAIWTHALTEIRGRRIAANGTLPGSIATDDGVLLARDAQLPDLVWDGSRFALAWNDHGRLHTAWLAQLGAPLVGERVVERVELDWSIAPVRPGLLATGYARIVDEPQAAGVHRAFVSLLQAPAPKRRAVR